jgi:flagellar hook-associated protein 2
VASSITGLGTASGNSSSGIDVGSVVDQLMQAQRQPEVLMQSQQSRLQQQSSALKSIQSRLSTLQTAADALRDPIGVFDQLATQSGDTSVFRASADSGATEGTHTVVVSRLSSIATEHSKVLSSPSDSFTVDSSFDLKVGTGSTVTVRFDKDHKTLSSAADYINGLKAGVNASVITGANGSQLVLTSQTSGTAGQVTISNDSTGLNMAQGNAGQNALVTIDGIDVESATNTVTGALPGVTLNLVSSAPGRTIALQTYRDTGAVSAAVQNYVSAYNSAISAVTSQFTYNQTTKTSGVLASDVTVRNLQQQLFTMVSRSGGTGSITSLAQLGVTMSNDGTLSVDSSKLTGVLSSNFSGVQQFFQDSKTGFAVQAGSDLDQMTDSTRSPVVLDLNGIDATSRQLTHSIADFEVLMTTKQKQLTDEYTRIDVMLRQFSSTQQSISSQLASLDSFRKSS